MTRSIRTAALQLSATPREAFARAWPLHLAAIEHAAAGSDLLVLPEATLPGYVLGDDRIDDAAIERAIAQLRDAAKRHGTVIVVGVAQRVNEQLRNRALAIEADGTIAGHADKLFLWHFDRKWFDAGDTLEPVATSLGRLGILVCADGRMPEIASTLVDRGAEMLVMPTAWVTSGRDPEHLENGQADLLARVRAYENGVPFVAANKCGVELGIVAYCGKSQIVSARGEVLAIADERNQTSITHALDIGGSLPHRGAGRPREREVSAPDPARNIRIAISMDAPDERTALRLATLDARCVLTPQGYEPTLGSAEMPTVRCSDLEPLDPGYLAGYRRLGYRVAAWDVVHATAWTQSVARARALELRIYVIVFDRQADRAYAVDPDGAIVAGTFGDYRMASFSLDLRRTMETSVAPGTDIGEGLERVHAAISGVP